jgi:hypothetical protein
LSFGNPALGKGLNERSQPPALLDSAARPVAIAKISVFVTAWRTGACRTMQPTPLAAA